MLCDPDHHLRPKAAIPLGLIAREVDSIPPCAHAFAVLENPNGIPPQSPGLRGTSYPGFGPSIINNRNAVAANPFPSHARRLTHPRLA